MKKDDLLAELCRATGLPRRHADAVVQAVFDTLSHGLAAGKRAEIRNFGNFTLRSSGAHTGRHPKTGAAHAVAAQRCVLFRPGKALRAKLNAVGEGDPKAPA